MDEMLSEEGSRHEAYRKVKDESAFYEERRCREKQPVAFAFYPFLLV
jgi:hypothetical protein